MDWIKVTDRMPPDDMPVIVSLDKGAHGKSVLGGAIYDPKIGWKVTLNGEYFWIFENRDGCKVTHWMPYPSPAED